MSSRGHAAAVVLVLWAAVLGWHIQREYFRPAVELLAEAARGLPPGAAYYAVFQGDRRVGWARSQMDTLPEGAGFRVSELLDLPASTPGPFRLRSDAELDATLSLRSFSAEAEGAPAGAPGAPATAVRLGGQVVGDTVLRAWSEGAEGIPDTVRVPLDGPVVPAMAWPLRAAARGDLRPDQRFRVRVFDPLSATVREVELRVLEAGLRSYPDSADRGPDGRWVEARRDTLPAWKVEQELAGIRLEAWLGRDGRLLEARLPGGLRLERTAFELAFFPAGADDPAADEGGARRTDAVGEAPR